MGLADEEMLRQLMASFREELAERLAAVNASLLALEQEPEGPQRGELLESLFRHVHSLKGAARAVSLHAIERLAHALEDALGAIQKGRLTLSAELFDLFYKGSDMIGAAMVHLDSAQDPQTSLDVDGYIERLSAAQRARPAAEDTAEALLAQTLPSAEPTLQPWSAESIRVPTARLDDLMAQTGELLAARLSAGQRLAEARRIRTLLNRWRRDWLRMRSMTLQRLEQRGNGQSDPVLAFLEQNQANLDAVTQWINDYVHHLSDDLARLSLATSELQEGVKRARMLPLANLVGAFRRMVRDLAREKGVEVTLETQGADTEMDKHVLEMVKDPLMHVLRNCIDHGIEPPQQREQAGKPRQGTISLRAERQGNVILLEIADDGAGIDCNAVRQAAVKRGILSAEQAAELGDEQAAGLIFVSGISTAPLVTQVSGRGVGLDVVRQNIEALQGHIEVRSTRGQGTTFILTLPLTLVSTRCLLLRAAEQLFAVPLSTVERLIEISPAELATVEGGMAISYAGRPVSVVRLADVLQLPGRGPVAAPADSLRAVILHAGGQEMAFIVDQFAGEQEVVVKSLGRQLARVPNIGGATVLGTGQVIHILNVSDLIKSARSGGGRALPPASEGPTPPPAETRKAILVVDDSITTRTLEKNILSAAGYDVHLAVDGEEALAALQESPIDLVVADIDMPRLDGFELTRRVKEDERYCNIPVILVTSMSSPEDRAKGIAVGADAYIVKSSFDQDELLDTIQQFI